MNSVWWSLYNLHGYVSKQVASSKNSERKLHIFDLGGIADYQREPLDTPIMGDHWTNATGANSEWLQEVLTRTDQTVETYTTSENRKELERRCDSTSVRR